MWLDAKFLSIRGRLSCYQQSRPFELWIPGEALPTLNNTLNVYIFSSHGMHMSISKYSVPVVILSVSGGMNPLLDPDQ